MTIQATKTMTKAINDYFRKNGICYKAIYTTMSISQYEWYVNRNSFENDNDYLIESSKMRAIKIIYPDGYYACPRYLSTRDLLRAYKESNKTYNGFFDALYNEIAC